MQTPHESALAARCRPDGSLNQALDRANSDIVLIVDDVPDNLSVLRDALDESGYTVLVATSGESALQRAHQALPDIVLLDAMMAAREAEVLYWVVKGKINRDIGDILGASPATVKKHLERVYAKLGVETRTAAAGMAMSRVRQLHPQFEG